MIFNPSRTVDVHPIIELDGTQLEIVESMRLLGVIISSDMKWHLNTEFITKRGYSRLWLLRRLKKFGVPTEELLDTYTLKVRSMLEMAVPVWQPALTKGEATLIERVQKSALRIILGQNYFSYDDALDTLQIEKLDIRRTQLCKSFATKSAKSEKYSGWFLSPEARPDTRSKPNYSAVWTRTSRFKKSPLPYLTELLNG